MLSAVKVSQAFCKDCDLYHATGDMVDCVAVNIYLFKVKSHNGLGYCMSTCMHKQPIVNKDSKIA